MNYCLAGVTGDPETFSQAASSEYCVGMDFKVKVTLCLYTETNIYLKGYFQQVQIISYFLFLADVSK